MTMFGKSYDLGGSCHYWEERDCITVYDRKSVTSIDIPYQFLAQSVDRWRRLEAERKALPGRVAALKTLLCDRTQKRGVQ